MSFGNSLVANGKSANGKSEVRKWSKGGSEARPWDDPRFVPGTNPGLLPTKSPVCPCDKPSEVNKRGRPSKCPPECLPSKFADFECAFSL